MGVLRLPSPCLSYLSSKPGKTTRGVNYCSTAEITGMKVTWSHVQLKFVSMFFRHDLTYKNNLNRPYDIPRIENPDSWTWNNLVESMLCFWNRAHNQMKCIATFSGFMEEPDPIRGWNVSTALVMEETLYTLLTRYIMSKSPRCKSRWWKIFYVSLCQIS